MAKTIQIRSITLSDTAGHADILTVMSSPKKYGLPDGANKKVLVLAILNRYAEEAIKKYGSDSGDGKDIHTYDSDDSDDAMTFGI